MKGGLRLVAVSRVRLSDIVYTNTCDSFQRTQHPSALLPGHGNFAGIPGSIRRDTDPGMKSGPDTPLCSRVRRPLMEVLLLYLCFDKFISIFMA